MQLNPEQLEAVNHFQGPCLVTATPGSGKTRTLTARTVSLVRERGVNPRNVLCLTFTNKAAREMRERIGKEVGQAAAEITIGTFHSIFARYLRKYGRLVGLEGNFTILDQDDQWELMAKVARMEDYECKKDEIKGLAEAIDSSREGLESLLEVRQGLTDIQLDIIREYLRTLDRTNCVDFTGILFKTYKLLKDHPSVINELARQFQFVLVDEGQDTSKIQYEIVKMLTMPHRNCFIVADIDQSIYSWRNARPENLRQFVEDFGGVRQIRLPRNYRSTAPILHAAQRLIRHNEGSEEVVLISERGEGNAIQVYEHVSGEDEASRVAEEVLLLRKRSNLKWKDFAVLYRTNAMSRALEMQFRRLQIPYKIVGGFSFFDRSEIKTSIAYMMFLENPFDTIAFTRAIKNPKRKIGDTVIGRLERICQAEGISMLQACRENPKVKGMTKLGQQNLASFIQLYEAYRAKYAGGMPLGQLATGLIKETGFLGHIEELSKTDQDHAKRIDNLREFFTSIAEFEKKARTPTLTDFLQSIQLISDVDEADTGDDVVQLSTIHSAKGLEWPVVHIVGAEEGLLPHSRALAETGHDEEERRLFYVAMTRAQDQLYVHFTQMRTAMNVRSGGAFNSQSVPSRFVEETGLLEQVNIMT